MNRSFYKNFAVIVGLDIFLVAFAWYVAHILRFNFNIPPESFSTLKRLLPVVIALKILGFFFWDLYRGMWRYTSLRDLANIIRASTVGSLAIILLILFFHGFSGYSRSIFIIDWILTTILIAGSRVGIRIFFMVNSREEGRGAYWKRLLPLSAVKKGSRKRLLIIGAGDCGEKIYREIRDNAHLKYDIVGFLDDDPVKANLTVHGVPVLGSIEEIKRVVDRVVADELLIAIPSATSSQSLASSPP